MKGKMVVIEGLDGAGKSTQIDLLQKHFKTFNIETKFIHFPMLDQGVYGALISEFLRGEFGTLEEVHPKLVALLFANDRNEHKETLKQWLEEGYMILTDRYVNSNIAFQCAKLRNPKEKELLKKWILDYEYSKNELPVPAVSFFLDVHMDEIGKTLSGVRSGTERNYLKGKEDIHEQSFDLQKSVYAEYHQMLKEQNNFIKIEGHASNGDRLQPEVISKEIIKTIEAKIALPQ